VPSLHLTRPELQSLVHRKRRKLNVMSGTNAALQPLPQPHSKITSRLRLVPLMMMRINQLQTVEVPHLKQKVDKLELEVTSLRKERDD